LCACLRLAFCRVRFIFFSTVLRQDIGWEERLRKDLSCVKASGTQNPNQSMFNVASASVVVAGSTASVKRRHSALRPARHVKSDKMANIGQDCVASDVLAQ